MYASKLIAEDLATVYRVKVRVGEKLDVIEIRQREGLGPMAPLTVYQGEVRYRFMGWHTAAYQHFCLAQKTSLSDPDCVERIKQNVGLYFAICSTFEPRRLYRYLKDIQ
jgi:hypothetical protein